MKRLTALSLLLLFFITAFSRQHSGFLKGTVTATDSTPLAGATIALYRMPDTVLVKAGVAESNGAFILEGIVPASYAIRISFAGYKDHWLDTIYIPASGRLLPAILSEKETQILAGVTVTASRPILERKLGSTLINITPQVLKEANNAFDILRFAPTLYLPDSETDIEMSGKTDVQVMLNGKLVRMSGRDLIKLLKSIPAGTVAQVEVMSTPSSKYDVQGSTGIIHIKTQKAITGGLNGSIDYSHSKAVNNMGDLSNSLNYGRGRLYLSGYLAYHFGKYRTLTDETRYANPLTQPTLLMRRSSSIDQWSDPVVRLGADWFIHKKHTLGALVETERSTNKSAYTTFTDIITSPDLIDTSLSAISHAPNTRLWSTANLNYRYADTLGTELNADIDRSYYKKNNDNTVSTAGSKVNNSYIAGQELYFHNPEIIDILTFKTDYSKILPSKLKLEAGLKLSFVNNKNDNLAQYTINGNRYTDSTRTNTFRYRERIHAAYFIISKKLSQWAWQAGLRAEDTRSIGKAMRPDLSMVNQPDLRYFNLLPSLGLSFSPAPAHQLSLSAEQRIKRPDYADLQPLDYAIDQFMYHLGNPALGVQKNTNMELNYVLNNKLNITASYSRARDYFSDILFQKNDTFYEIKQNTGRLNSFNTIISYPIKPAPWWSAENRFSISHNQFTGALLEGFLKQAQWSYSIYTNHRFEVFKACILRLSAWYTAPQQQLYVSESSSASVSLSVGRSLFKKRGSIQVRYADIFKTQRRQSRVDFGNLRYQQLSTWESRSISLNFSLRFGNTTMREGRNRQTGNTDEVSRTK